MYLSSATWGRVWLVYVAGYVALSFVRRYGPVTLARTRRAWSWPLVTNVTLVGPLTVYVWCESLAHPEWVEWTQLLSVGPALLGYDVLFWILHRWTHQHPWVYATIHSWHHAWRRTTHAESAFDAHPLEHLGLNVLPLLVSGWLVLVPRVILLSMAFLGSLLSQVYHSSPGQHDLHHAYRVCGFGVLRVMDYLMGTQC